MVTNRQEYKKYFEAYEYSPTPPKLEKLARFAALVYLNERDKSLLEGLLSAAYLHSHHDSLIEYLGHVGILVTQLTNVRIPRWNINDLARDKASRKEALKKLVSTHLDPKVSVHTDTGERQFDDREKEAKSVSVRALRGGNCSGR